MMSELESHIEGTACNKAEKAGWLVRKVKWIGRVGAPDRMFIKNGQIILMEFKKSGKEPSVKQEREHDRFRSQGVEVYLVDDWRVAVDIWGVKH